MPSPFRSTPATSGVERDAALRGAQRIVEAAFAVIDGSQRDISGAVRRINVDRRLQVLLRLSQVRLLHIEHAAQRQRIRKTRLNLQSWPSSDSASSSWLA